MRVLLLAATSIAFFVGGLAFASEENVDGDRLSECYGIYDAMVGLSDAGKLSSEERPQFETKRLKAESLAMARLQAEGLNEDLAREQLEGHALYMRSEARDLRGGVGIHGVDDIRKLAQACDPLVAE